MRISVAGISRETPDSSSILTRMKGFTVMRGQGILDIVLDYPVITNIVDHGGPL